MPPKKRDKDGDVIKNPIYEQLQADHELFLQAFEKPTQIYRFLRTRNLVSPIFLERTLTYMKHRMSRTHKIRNTFKVDSVLTRVLAKQKDSQSENFSGFMNLTFTGFFDPSNKDLREDHVVVETILLKICHKKRKDVSCPVMQTTVGKSEVPCNPDPVKRLTQAFAVSVPCESFSLSNGHLVKSYVLLLRVSSTASKHATNGVCNGDLSDSDPDEPPAKKRKNGKIQAGEEKVFGAELIVYDKHNRCLLTEGQYELVLQEIVTTKGSPKKLRSWETFVDPRDKQWRDGVMVMLGPHVLEMDGSSPLHIILTKCKSIRMSVSSFEVFTMGPTLKFMLNWSETPKSGLVPMPPPIIPASNSVGKNKDNDSKKCKEQLTPEKLKKRIQIFYQFLYNNNTRQQTEAREDLHCPWCSLNCVHLYSLLKHLKLCHGRFSFTYVPHPKGARIDVSINDCYDGSYAGNPHDLHSQPPGFAFSRNGPVRRTPVTNVMVCRPQRLPPNLAEFLEPDDSEFDTHRPYISGHNRLYHHTGTCLPIRPQEIDIDSEEENDPEWLRTKTKLMIDEFTDVNEGEKELMKLWNLHVMKFVGDCQIPLACSMFIEKHGREVIERNLYKNFVLHVCSMFDFGLVGAVVVFKTIRQLQEVKDQIDLKTNNNHHHSNFNHMLTDKPPS